MRNNFLKCLLLLLMTAFIFSCATSKQNKTLKYAAYLMVYFKDDDHSLHMAISTDAKSFTDVNKGKAVIAGDTIAEQKGIRDPHIFRGSDGTFYLSMTDLHIFGKEKGLRKTQWERSDDYGWGNNRGFVLMKSKNLINWSVTRVRVDQAFPGFEEIGCAWAPEVTYDDKEKKLMIYYTMRFKNGKNQLYYSYVNDDFNKLLSLPKLLFQYPKDISYIDADITKVNDQYHMFYTPHDGTPGIKQAVSNKINADYVFNDTWIDPEPKACEAPHIWKINDENRWILVYDIYGIKPHNFGFMETTDFKSFKDLGHFNEGVMKATNFSSPKHAAVISLTKEEALRLAKHWGMDLQFKN
ncbi:glycoside hydrolase family 43 protein [Flavobacterium sp. WC2509]|uniref:glycoside hydrolase family 43 protein n=1 Tax=Flavobacterium sp. WC2509 TaxID=3461406 RepID=UPI004043C1AB